LTNIKRIIREEVEDFQWIKDTQEETLRFFDVYVCDEMEYQEDTGEDECTGHGGSYFLRIPTDVTNEIWGGDIDYMGGPGDEGLGIIEWMNDNGKLDPDDYGSVEYVREIDKEEFCMAVRHSNEDICY
jgi:hypothetical protein